MIVGQFHEGSGLGNQLHRYVAARVRARDLGVSFGMINPHLFKGDSFMRIDKGEEVKGKLLHSFTEKKVVENGVDIRGYDPEINFVEESTLIEGEFQDERYWEHRIDEVREWLRVESLKMASNLCVIGFRGGEYTMFPDLFLTKDYWDEAIKRMSGLKDTMKFEVHTDDPITAKKFFPDFPIIHEIGLNWRSVRYANYLIIANSSFYIFPALLNQEVKKVYAPRFWARRNTKVWALPQNYYKAFTYL